MAKHVVMHACVHVVSNSVTEQQDSREFVFSWTTAEPRVVFVRTYQLSYMLNILFLSDSSWLISVQPSSFNLMQKIFSRTDC